MTARDHEPPRRRRRADAQRSRSAVLTAAAQVLGTHPEAGLDDVAKAAGVSRQTVYAHFGSRESLVDAVLDHVTSEVVAAMDAAAIDGEAAETTLLRLLDASRSAAQRHPLLLQDSRISAERSRDLHRPIMSRFTEVIERAQREGEFTDRQPSTWLASAIISLAHTAAELAGTGQLDAQAADAALHTGIRRLIRPD
ncbi:DNA-binding transcriptional regulator, AcrR family [Prauserella marina]|uniref:DNA-binding transcriptional regulator, AcrR family n=1 Tax=Prauserella marina TaxID=530584 RepID=A0A1G6JXP5_9PSEU|nr:TetR/AcrR family transcriptional regulator [Prauserella marina]PWV84413.1 TetR family transcriptional regulator [Prauserella marina]SDC23175.1 DNA-binding transcriptional regulator, AcrR family [Prauserella marina]